MKGHLRQRKQQVKGPESKAPWACLRIIMEATVVREEDEVRELVTGKNMVFYHKFGFYSA